jgi:biopolymer transport protein TolR
MSDRRRGRRRKLLSEINVVPFIDITFVLLVIFMMTAPLQQRTVDVQLPIAVGAPLEQKSLSQLEQFPIIISVQKNGQYFLSERGEAPAPLLLDLLLFKVAALHKNQPQLPFYLKADSEVSYGKVVAVMDKLKKAGVPQIGLVTRSAEP